MNDKTYHISETDTSSPTISGEQIIAKLKNSGLKIKKIADIIDTNKTYLSLVMANKKTLSDKLARTILRATQLKHLWT